MSDLIDTTEMYLRTIYELQEEGIHAMRARLVERLGHSGPTVSQTVARMERDGLLRLSDDRTLEFTDEGRRRAMRVMRKHRLAERLLVDVIGLEWQYAHDEACRWEHVMSDRVERKLLTMLQETDRLLSPYGNPIPGLDELDGLQHEVEPFRDHLDTVLQVLDASGGVQADVVVRRLGESVQRDTRLLNDLYEAGVQPGATVRVSSVGAGVAIGAGGEAVTVDAEVAQLIFVQSA